MSGRITTKVSLNGKGFFFKKITHLSIHSYIHISIHSFIYLSHPSVQLFIHLSTCPFFHLSICPSIQLSVPLSNDLSARLSIHPSPTDWSSHLPIHLSICLFSYQFFLSIHPPVHSFIHFPICSNSYWVLTLNPRLWWMLKRQAWELIVQKTPTPGRDRLT